MFDEERLGVGNGGIFDDGAADCETGCDMWTEEGGVISEMGAVAAVPEVTFDGVFIDRYGGEVGVLGC